MERIGHLIKRIESLIGSFKNAPPKEVVDEANSLIDELCDLYLTAVNGVRLSSRRAISDLRNFRAYLQFDYVRYACHMAQENQDEKWIRRALAAISIEDLIFDYRDSLTSLGLIHKVAGECGINFFPIINQVAQISNAEKNKLDIGPTRDCLLKFAQTFSKNRS